MEVVLSAVASDLVGRLVSFLIRKCPEFATTTNMDKLQRALLRARMVVEEAEGRQVTNRAMLQQLNQLRREMCRGAYVLDAFMKRAAADPGWRHRATARRSFCQLPPQGSDGTDGLAVVGCLEAALDDMKEFLVLLGGCPRVNRQPYSADLFMESCMFGRQMEKELIIGFLLQPAQDLDVLPIIGPHEVGKRTLVEHVCLEERVREHFAKIHRLTSDDLDLPSHDHEHHLSLIDSTERSLIVINFAGDGDEEESWKRFLSSMRHRGNRESKIILISRTKAHSRLGTVPPLRLRAPRREELWYFFKALAFGGADPEERPELVRIAMALFASIPDLMPFAAANIIAAPLRADLSARSWRRVLKVFAGVTELQFGALPAGGGGRDPLEETGYYYPCMPVNKEGLSTPCLFYNGRKLTAMARSEVPKVRMLELLAGGAVLPGGDMRFDVLLWQSRIPPYASYVSTCDMDRAHQQVVAGKQRLFNKRRRGQQQDVP